MATVGKNRDVLPVGVFPKGRWYYRVRAQGAKRIWSKLSPIADGLPALYAALSQALAEGVADDRMPAVIAAWQRDVMPQHAEKTQRDDKARCKVVADAFAEFAAGQVQAPDVADFLAPFADRPRTFNAYRSLMLELMRYSIVRGFRTDNPVAHVRTARTMKRDRYLTDSEVRRIKVGGIYGDDGRPTRSGRMFAALVDVAYLTGQRIGDLLDLRWQRDDDDPDAPHVSAEGLRFGPEKTRKKTRAAVLIRWTPKLRAAVERVRVLQAERLLKRRAGQRVVSGFLFTGQDGTPLSYSGAASMWRRARLRAKVADCRIHDLRAKALTDKDEREGIGAARTMGAHSTEGQTADYIRGRKARETGATR